jgi:hypothetical protein
LLRLLSFEIPCCKRDIGRSVVVFVWFRGQRTEIRDQRGDDRRFWTPDLYLLAARLLRSDL